MSPHPSLASAVFAAALLFAVNSYAMDDFGGSFGDGSQPPVESEPPQATPPAAIPDDPFGGSFTGNGSSPPGGGTPVTQAPDADSQDAPGGDAFTGSFSGEPVSNGGTPPATTTDVPVVGGEDFNSLDPDGQQAGPPPQSVQPGPVVQTPQPDTSQQDLGPQLDPRITAFETRDFGVPPQNRLPDGPMHAPTPTALPGALVVTTQALATAMRSGVRMLLIDALGADYALPGAVSAPALGSSGSYSDRIQQQAVQWLNTMTGGNKGLAVVVYCSDPECWLSYNAALRTVAAGYTSVYWYRGGLQAWQMAGLPVQPSGF